MNLFEVWDKEKKGWFNESQYALDNPKLNLVYCDMDGVAMHQDGSLIVLDECGNFANLDPDRFEIVWQKEVK